MERIRASNKTKITLSCPIHILIKYNVMKYKKYNEIRTFLTILLHETLGSFQRNTRTEYQLETNPESS